MASRLNKELKQILHPYVFVLKEGKKISDNYLDYSLLILQVGHPETLKSPPGFQAPSEFDTIQLGDVGDVFEDRMFN